MSVWGCHFKILSRCCVRCTFIFSFQVSMQTLFFLSNQAKSCRRSRSTLCFSLFVTPTLTPCTSLSPSILYVPLFSSPILPPFSSPFSYWLPWGSSLLRWIWLVCVWVNGWLCMSEHISLHDYYDLVGIHLEFSRVITLNYSQQNKVSWCFTGAMAIIYCRSKHQPVCGWI